jgi:N-acetylmuramoyl-L-alanine amidase
MRSAYISPSGQEHNIGPNGYVEEVICNLIADVVIPILEYNSITTYRNTPDMEYWQSKDDSNSKHPDIHFAIHTNAFDTTLRGCEVYYYTGSNDGLKLATAVYNRVSAITPTDDRGVKANNQYTELAGTNAVAALIEVAFHDNAFDAAWLVANIKPIGEAIALGICEYFGIAGKLPIQSEWKELGAKYLYDMGYTTMLHDPLAVIDYGTLGALLHNFNDRFTDMIKKLYKI